MRWVEYEHNAMVNMLDGVRRLRDVFLQIYMKINFGEIFRFVFNQKSVLNYE